MMPNFSIGQKCLNFSRHRLFYEKLITYPSSNTIRPEPTPKKLKLYPGIPISVQVINFNGQPNIYLQEKGQTN